MQEINTEKMMLLMTSQMWYRASTENAHCIIICIETCATLMGLHKCGVTNYQQVSSVASASAMDNLPKNYAWKVNGAQRPADLGQLS